MMNGYEYTGMDAILAGSFRAAIYCRLSKDDDLDGESASIANQRDMLEKYCEKQGWEVVAVYQDDGYTGLNMERPDLKRMLKAIERRQINLVITKDLSRLGRNYLQTGTLIEDFFPRHGVRYIAMNDGIDTMRENNDIAPFKNILNEMYSKDISKKVHSSYLLKAQQGQFTGCIAPFGYQKDPEDKNHLLVDEETAPIVRQIFRWALEGHGPNFIRRRLEEQKVPCPTWWNRERGFRNVRTKWEKKDPVNGRYMWDFSVIKDILMNPVYTGAIASQKKDYRFKIGTIGEKKPQDWIVVEERHEPIVDRKSFDIVQDKLKSRQRSRQTGEISLFAGLLKCGECGKSLTIRYTGCQLIFLILPHCEVVWLFRFQCIKHQVYGVFELLVILTDFHGVDELDEGGEVLLLHRSFIVDISNQRAIQQCFRLDPEIVSGLAFAFGIGDQRCYQLQNVLFAMDIGERVIVHGLLEVDGI